MTVRAAKLPAITEREFQSQVIALAKLRGFRVAHFRPAMTRSGKWATPVQADGAGFPDLLMVRGPVMIAAELKVGRNRATPEQHAWLLALGGAGVDARIWRPEDWPEIERTLNESPDQLPFAAADGT